MFKQWEIDRILNIWFTCIRMKLSCTFYPRTLIKYFLKNIPKEAFVSNFQLSKIFVEA